VSDNTLENNGLANPGLTLAVVSLSYLMLVMDNSVAVAALPLIQRDLGFSVANLAWVQNSYTLIFGGFLMLGARLGDIHGRRKMFQVGLAAFAFASLLLGLAPTAPLLLLGRVLQGLAAAILAPSTLALLSTSFPIEPTRGRALAVYGSVTGSGTTLGLVLGGFIAGTIGWRWAFLINVPLGLMLMFVTKRSLGETQKHNGRLDIMGALTSTLGMSAVVFALIYSAEAGWANLETIGAFAGGILVLAVFVRIESKVASPIMPLRLFGNAQRNAANGARALFVGSMVGFYFFGSQFLQNSLGLTPFQTGLAFLPMTLASFGIAFLVPRLSRKFGDAPFLAGGLATVAIGTLWLASATTTGNYLFQLALPMMLIGIGQGAATIRLTSAGIAKVSPADSGAASGIVSVAVQLGSSLGLSLLVSFSAFTVTANQSLALVSQEHLGSAMRAGSVLVLLALVLVTVFVLPKHPQSSKT
jgi:EmrB/QacA subfamily drug resistance transporter